MAQLSSLRTAHASISRQRLDRTFDAASLINNEINDLVDELLPVGEFRAHTLTVSGRWDALTDSFLLSGRVFTPGAQ